MVRRSKLPRRLTLKKRAEITALLDQGRRLSGNSFALVWQPSEQFRYAILLSRGHGNAVRRNQVKRLFREAIRLCRYKLLSNVKIAIFPRPVQDPPQFEQIKTDVCRAFEKINREL